MLDSSALDTLVVDRRRSRRNPAVHETVRASRRRLMAEGLPDGTSSHELIVQTGRSSLGYSAAMLPLLALIGLIGVALTNQPLIFVWAAVTGCLHIMLAQLMRWRAKADDNPKRDWLTEPMVQALHLPLAIAWVWFVSIDCLGCALDAVAVYRADALLIAMALTALMHANVRFALPITFTPAVLAMLFHVDGSDDIGDIAMLALAGGGLLLFSFVAARARRANLDAFRLQYEKDVLIGELETAKAISDSARHKAEEANLAKSRFLASMSHELRTPLNAIMGFSEVMAEEILGPVENPTYKGYVRDIHVSGKHLLSLINEILDLSRVEADRYPLEFKPHDLSEIAEIAVSTLRVKADQKNIDLSLDAEQGLARVIVDERAIRQSILNLVSNAVKFTPLNGRVTVTVGLTASGGQYVTVSDTGPGIPQEELPLVLSAFGQGSIALKQAEQGTGLGLPIVQALLKKHDGRFVLASELRKGTHATISLPRSRVEGSGSEEDPTEPRSVEASEIFAAA